MILYRTCHGDKMKFLFLCLLFVFTVFLFLPQSCCHGEPAKRLAAALQNNNNMPENSVIVDIYHRKALYVTVHFNQLPPNGRYQIKPLIHLIENNKQQEPIFLHCYLPGGNLTPFLDIPNAYLRLVKIGNTPISFDSYYVPRVQKCIHFNGFYVDNWRMDEVMKIPDTLKIGNLDIRLQNEPFDWTLLKRFSALSALRIRNASGFTNASAIDRVTAALTLDNCRDLQFPPHLDIFLLSLEKCRMPSGLFEKLNAEKLYSLSFSACPDLSLPDLSNFRSLRSIEFQDCDTLKDLNAFRSLQLSSITIFQCRNLKDISAVKAMGRINTVKFYNTGLTDWNAFRGCRIFYCDVYGDLTRVKVVPEAVRQIENLHIGTMTYHYGILKPQNNK